MSNNIATPAALKTAVLSMRAELEKLILEAAKQLPLVGFHTYYADGTWSVIVEPNGTVRNRGYAEENHGPTRNLCSLATWELGYLLEELETGNFQRREAALKNL